MVNRCDSTLLHLFGVWWVLSLLHSKKLAFSVDIFHYFLIVQVLGRDGLISVKARSNKKLIVGIPWKYRGWKDQFLFVIVPKDFHLSVFWKNLWNGSSSTPELAEEEEDWIRCLMDVPVKERTFRRLISAKVLKRMHSSNSHCVFYLWLMLKTQWVV